MVVTSFSIDKLWDRILLGTKTQTMRPVWVKDEKTKELRPNKKWQAVQDKIKRDIPVELNLGWKTRSKTGFMFCNMDCVSCETKVLGDLTLDEWKADGFESITEGFEWFGKTYAYYKELPNPTLADFEVYKIKWRTGSCLNCAYLDKCQRMIEIIPETSYIKQADSEFLCSGWRRSKNGEFPFFTNLSNLIGNAGTRPMVDINYWIKLNCLRCKNCYQKTAGCGVAIDGREEQMCCLQDESRSYYPDDMAISDLWFYINTQSKLRILQCPEFKNGIPTMIYYENAYSEEEDL